jgi:hypothetical protein
MKDMVPKKPKSAIEPTGGKHPRAEFGDVDYGQQKPSWLLGSLDLDGPWGWHSVTEKDLVSEVLPKLKNFESMNWTEILNRNSHEVRVSEICKDAQSRLDAISNADIESLISLHLTGQKRVLGIRFGGALKILWWDPEHKVYPSAKKHT